MRRTVMRVSRLVLLLFLAVQAFDGIFTYVAVRALGPGMESNLLLASWMAAVGPVPTLLAAKSVAAGAGLLVHRHGLHELLAGLTLVYACLAIGPWLYVYVTWP